MCVHLRQVFIIEHVGIGFGEDNAARAFKRRVGKPFDVVTLEKTHAGDRVRPQSLAKLLAELTGGINSSDSAHDDCSSLRVFKSSV